MTELQTERSFVVELTPEDAQGTQSRKSIHTKDTKPISLSGREWSAKNYITLWTGILASIPVYMVASALLSVGLTWYQVLFIYALGYTLVLIPSIPLRKSGFRCGASFPVLSKMVSGPKGAAIPTTIRAFMGCLWSGIQNWIGGTALDTTIAVIFPAYTGLAFHSFLSFGLFVLINFYTGYHDSPAIRFLEDFAAPILIILSGVVIVWAFWLVSQKGGFVALFTTQVADGNGRSFWSQLFPSLTPMITFDATIALDFSDYIRHAKTEGAQMKGQLIGAPIMTVFVVSVSICGIPGSKLVFGEASWDPSTLVSHLGSPAAVIIFPLFIILATLTTNVACNLTTAPVVFFSLLGKVFTYKKAVVMVTILSICFLPQKLVENPESYVYTLSGALAVFLGPITGICLAALRSQHRNRPRLLDLYYQDGDAYYYQDGWNVLALVTMAVLSTFIFVCQLIPVLKWIYDSSYLLGCVFAFVIYSALCKRQGR